MVTQLLDSDRPIREGHHTVKIASSDGEGGGPFPGFPGLATLVHDNKKTINISKNNAQDFFRFSTYFQLNGLFHMSPSLDNTLPSIER